MSWVNTPSLLCKWSLSHVRQNVVKIKEHKQCGCFRGITVGTVDSDSSDPSSSISGMFLKDVECRVERVKYLEQTV